MLRLLCAVRTRGTFSSLKNPLSQCTRDVSSSPTFVIKPVRSSELTSIKQERFGSLLEQFKAEYEAPIIESFLRVKELKKRVGVRKARKIMGKPVHPDKLKKRAKVQSAKSFESRELRMERSIQTYLRKDKSKRELFFGRTPEERARREQVVGALMHGHFWEPQSPDAEYDAEDPPPEVAANPLANYKWEKTLDDMKLAEVIAKEMEREGLSVSWDKITNDNRERQRRLSGQDDATMMHRELAFGRAMVKESELVEERPALLKASRVQKVKKIVKPKIVKVNSDNPIAFETVHFPLNKAIYSPFRTRKVVMYIHVDSLNMPFAVRERLIEMSRYHETQAKIIKPRYDKSKGLLKLSSRSMGTLRANRAAVIKLFRRLVNEAWKADLNFVAPTFSSEVSKLAPHERIVVEEKVLESRELAAKNGSIDTLRESSQKGFTVFRIAEVDLPNLDILNEQRKRASELVKEVRDAI